MFKEKKLWKSKFCHDVLRLEIVRFWVQYYVETVHPWAMQSQTQDTLKQPRITVTQI